MRTRNRDTTESVPAYQQIYAKLKPTSGSPGKFAWYTVTSTNETLFGDYTGTASDTDASKVGIIESMTDEESGHGVYNEVSHSKEEWDFPLVHWNTKGENTYNGNTSEGRVSAARSGGWQQVSGFSTPQSWADLSTAVTRATARMQFGIQDAPVNLPTFLGELRDFRYLFKGLFGRSRFEGVRRNTRTIRPSLGWNARLQAMRSQLQRYGRTGLNLRSAIDLLIRGDLLNKFAIQPLIRDLEGIKRGNDHLVSQYSRLQRMQEQPLAVRGTYVDPRFDDFSSTDGPYHKVEKSVTSSRHTTAWALVKYNLSEMPSMPAIMADMYGFNDGHLTAWELTPLSFLLDYVVDIQQWLQQFRGDFIQIPYTILQEGYSTKVVSTATTRTHYYSEDSTGLQLWNTDDDPGRIAEGSVKRTYYDRIKSPLPYSAMTLPQVQLPSFEQGITATEVAYMLFGR